MTQDLRVRSPESREVELTPPLVQIRSADVGQGHLDHDRTRLGIHHRILPDLHRLTLPVERCHPPRHPARHRTRALNGTNGPPWVRDAPADTPSGTQTRTAKDDGINAYQTYRQTQAQTAAPGELVLMLYRGAVRFVGLAVEAIDAAANRVNGNALHGGPRQAIR